MGVAVDDDKIDIIQKYGIRIISSSFNDCDFRNVKLNRIVEADLVNENIKNRSLIIRMD